MSFVLAMIVAFLATAASFSSKIKLYRRLSVSTIAKMTLGDADDLHQHDRDFLPGIVQKKNGVKSDNRDNLPYSIFFIVDDDNKKHIGTYRLDATITSGDVLDLGLTGMYTVKRISFLYKYTKSGFKVFKKKIDVTMLSSSSMLKDSDSHDSYLQ